MSEIGVGQTLGKNELLHVGQSIRDVRNQQGATIGDIQHHVGSYGIYEQEGLISRNSLKKFIEAITTKTKNKNNQILQNTIQPKKLNELSTAFQEPLGWVNANVFRLKELGFVTYSNGEVQTTELGKQLLEKNQKDEGLELKKLELLAHSDITWMKVKKIELVDNTEYVYDLTVDEYHNFVANQFIVHNTTTSGKLCHYYQKRGKKVGLIAADTFRPAAMEQLEQIAKKINATVILDKNETKPEKIIQQGLQREKEFDLLICDSAGRNALDSELEQEIKTINQTFKPDQAWLVLGADLGQIAGTQAKAFHDAVGVNGVIVTRMDGSAKGGGTLAACRQTNSPVYFIGTGEKTSDLEEFDAVRFLSRIMGYGDLQSLLEKAQEAAQDTDMGLEELLEHDYTLETFYKQLEATNKIGTMDKIMEMVGMKQQLPKEAAEQGQKKLEQFRFMMQSMTKKEKQNPDLINSSRIRRIARGSGNTQENVRELLKQYKRMKNAFKQLKGLDEKKLQQGMDMKKLQEMFSPKKKKKLRFR